MITTPLVSIALCTYNGEKYLDQQLDSILNQTFSDFELVVVDDCSTDSTLEILNKYAEKDSRIKVHLLLPMIKNRLRFSEGTKTMLLAAKKE